MNKVKEMFNREKIADKIFIGILIFILIAIITSMKHIIDLESLITIDRIINFKQIIGLMGLVVVLIGGYISIPFSSFSITTKIISKILIFISIIISYLIISYVIGIASELNVSIINILENQEPEKLLELIENSDSITYLEKHNLEIAFSNAYVKLMDWVFSPVLIGITIEFFSDIYSSIQVKVNR